MFYFIYFFNDGLLESEISYIIIFYALRIVNNDSTYYINFLFKIDKTINRDN